MRHARRAAAACFIRLLILGSVPLGVPADAAAWGTVGHRAIARVAAARLSGRATTAVNSLLGAQTTADVAMWADEVGRAVHPETARWHFVRIPIASDGTYRRDRDCHPTRTGDCIVEALSRLEATLVNPATPVTAQREALMFVIHLVGDAHQPLHASDNGDSAGNRRRIVEIGGVDNLHAAWDAGIIRASGQSVSALVRAANRWLLSNPVEPGTFVQWAEESFVIAKTVAYPQVQGDNEISPSERLAADEVIVAQIAKAGTRLAAVLNRVYQDTAELPSSLIPRPGRLRLEHLPPR